MKVQGEVSDALLEYSVVYSDRSLNHMSNQFIGSMQNISKKLKALHNASGLALVPGGGSQAMESIVRQFHSSSKNFHIVRNGWFSYRWSQIFEALNLDREVSLSLASRVDDSEQSSFAPEKLEILLEKIQQKKPSMVFAAHVETSAGMILPDDYLKKLASTIHEYGGLLVLDCIASGCSWLDMREIGIDFLITVPQKGWSAQPGVGVVLMSELALARMEITKSDSFCSDLKKWYQLMQVYEQGSHMYHLTMPTDVIDVFSKTIDEIQFFGWQQAKNAQELLASRFRSSFESLGFKSVAAEGFQASSVVVCFTDDDDKAKGLYFKNKGIQVAAGVPLMCDEGEAFKSFRIGLFGLDKLRQPELYHRRFFDRLP